MQRETRSEPTTAFVRFVQSLRGSPAAGVPRRAEEQAKGARPTMRERLREWQIRLTAWMADFESLIRRRPLLTSSGALGAGFLAGFLLRWWQLLKRGEVSIG